MKAIVKYIKETLTFSDLVEGEFIDVTEEVDVPHAIVNGKDIGRITNLSDEKVNKLNGSEIEVTIFKDVCVECHDDPYHHDCVCEYQRGYEKTTIIKAVCPCCGRAY